MHFSRTIVSIVTPVSVTVALLLLASLPLVLAADQCERTEAQDDKFNAHYNAQVEGLTAFCETFYSDKGITAVQECMEGSIYAAYLEACNVVDGLRLMKIDAEFTCTDPSAENELVNVAKPYYLYPPNSKLETCVKEPCTTTEFMKLMARDVPDDETDSLENCRKQAYVPKVSYNTCERSDAQSQNFFNLRNQFIPEDCFFKGGSDVKCNNSRAQAIKDACASIEGLMIVHASGKYVCSGDGEVPTLDLGPNGESCVPTTCTIDDFQDIEDRQGVPVRENCSLELDYFSLNGPDPTASSTSGVGSSDRSVLFAGIVAIAIAGMI